MSFVHSIDELFSIVTDKGSEKPEVCPAELVAVVLRKCFPKLRAEEVMEKAPLLPAVAEPKRVEPL